VSIRILVGDDDLDWRTLLRGVLGQAGVVVTPAATGAAALTCLQKVHFDLIILDVQLPDCDGYAVCAEVRQREGYVPIIMISGVKKEDVDQELGLNTGANHYFKKPVSARVVVAQVRAMLNMASALKKDEPAAKLLSPGAPLEVLQLDFVNGEFKRGDHALALTSLEIKLLLCLNRKAGQLVTVDDLIRAGWKDRVTAGEARGRLKSAIKRLRRKIELDSKHPRYLITVRGDGYYLCLEPKQSDPKGASQNL
jgi:DNA-binding response OmpR family regulator